MRIREECAVWAEAACPRAQGLASGVGGGFSPIWHLGQKPLCSARPAQPRTAVLHPEDVATC